MPAEPDLGDRAAVVDYVVGSAKACSGGSPYFDEAAVRALVERDMARTKNIAAMLTNHNIIDFDGPIGGGFGEIGVPTLVVHGDHDPVLPLPYGEAVRDAIPGAELLVLEGRGTTCPGPVPYAAAGATWWLAEFPPGVSLDQVRGVLHDGPLIPGLS